jgi:flavin-dependent dehydrogenase
VTNVCGLAPERLLRECGFAPEALFSEPLQDRVAPLERAMEWSITGPLVARDEFKSRTRVYPAGDALGFVEPFTGSAALAALLNGRLAGQAEAPGSGVEEHQATCRQVLGRQYGVTSLLRQLLSAGLAEKPAAFVPGGKLYRLTRLAV